MKSPKYFLIALLSLLTFKVSASPYSNLIQCEKVTLKNGQQILKCKNPDGTFLMMQIEEDKKHERDQLPLSDVYEIDPQ